MTAHPPAQAATKPTISPVDSQATISRSQSAREVAAPAARPGRRPLSSGAAALLVLLFTMAALAGGQGPASAAPPAPSPQSSGTAASASGLTPASTLAPSLGPLLPDPSAKQVASPSSRPTPPRPPNAPARTAPPPASTAPTDLSVSAAEPSSGSGEAGLPGASAGSGVLGRVRDVVGTVTGAAGTGVASSVADGMMKAAAIWAVQQLMSGVEQVFGELGAFLSTTTHPQPTDASFLRPGGLYQQLSSFAVVMVIAFMCLQIGQGVLAGEPGQAVWQVVRFLPVTVLAIVAFPWFVAQLVAIADALTGLALPPDKTFQQLLQIQVLTSLKTVASGNPLPGMVMGLVAFLSALLIYLELLVHVVMVRLIEALAPLSLAPIVWAPARPAARKVAEIAVAAVLARPAILIALRVGLDLLADSAKASPANGGAWGRMLLGLAVILVAACSPVVIWRLLPHAEAMLASQGLSRGPGRAVMTGLQTAYWAGAVAGGGRAAGRALTPANAGPSTGPGGGPGGGAGGPGSARSLPPPSSPGPSGPRPGRSGLSTPSGGSPVSSGSGSTGHDRDAAGAAGPGAGQTRPSNQAPSGSPGSATSTTTPPSGPRPGSSAGTGQTRRGRGPGQSTRPAGPAGAPGTYPGTSPGVAPGSPGGAATEGWGRRPNRPSPPALNPGAPSRQSPGPGGGPAGRPGGGRGPTS